MDDSNTKDDDKPIQTIRKPSRVRSKKVNTKSTKVMTSKGNNEF